MPPQTTDDQRAVTAEERTGAGPGLSVVHGERSQREALRSVANPRRTRL